MKSKKIKVSGFLVVLLLLSVTVVLAATALSYETFQSKMESKGYTVTKAAKGYLTASPPGSVDELYAFYEYTSEDVAKLTLATLCQDVENDTEYNYISYSTLNCSTDYAGETGMVKAIYESSPYNTYMIAYRVKDTIMMGLGYEYNQEQVNDTMAEFGYYSGSSFFIFIIIGVFVVIGAGVVVLIVVLTKKKPNQQNMYGYNSNMPQNYQQPMNNQPMNNAYYQGYPNQGQYPNQTQYPNQNNQF